MALTDDFRAIVARLRGWGFNVREESGCYGRGNGTSWSGGRPTGHGNHHYVCSLNPDQAYIDALVANLRNGTVVNWFTDVNGRAYLIGTNPMNHFGTGNSSVLNKTKNDQPPPGNASSTGDMSGNQAYCGTECQHPGDSTPWPQKLLDVTFAINAAEFMQWGYSSNRAIMHREWTNRKIDMSWQGDLRGNVKKYMSGSPTPPTPQPPTGDWFDMATKADLQAAVKAELNAYFANGEGNPTNGRIVQACNNSIKNSTAAVVDAVWNEVMPSNADGNTPEKSQAGRKARDTFAALMTLCSRLQGNLNNKLFTPGTGQGQKTVGNTIAATLAQTQTNFNKISGIDKVVDERIKAHLGEPAVSNPNAALNNGIMARMNATDNKKFEDVPGYTPVT